MHLRPHEPGHQGPRPRRDLHHRARATAGRRSSPTRTSRGRTARSTRPSPATRRGCASCSASSRSRAGSRATSRPRRRARSTRAASSATRSRTRTARRSTTRTCSCAASSATARPRPARSPRAGTRTSSSTRRRDGAVLPILHLNGYKIANPTVLARIPREELTALMEGYGHTPYFVEGDDPRAVHQQLAATLDTVAGRDPRDPARRPRGRRHRARRAGR